MSYTENTISSTVLLRNPGNYLLICNFSSFRCSQQSKGGAITGHRFTRKKGALVDFYPDCVAL